MEHKRKLFQLRWDDNAQVWPEVYSWVQIMFNDYALSSEKVIAAELTQA
jgi:hypothetical protein